MTAREIFERALELDAAERGAYVEAACGERGEVLDEVRRMLRDAERGDAGWSGLDAETLVDGGRARGEDGVGRTERAGDWIGPYLLEAPIGEGGFGMVWQAEQRVPMVRKVALKVIKAGMDTREVLVRFEAERQALAMMDHPNIAKVLDAGATVTISAMNNLASAYAAGGRKERGLELSEEVLRLRRKVLGPKHPDTLKAMQNLAISYQEAGRREEALALLAELRAPDQNAAGDGFPRVISVLLPPDSEWKWLHPPDGADPAARDPDFYRTFSAIDYDDAAWKRGKDSGGPSGGFGYGDKGFTGVDIGTPADAATGGTAWFRCRFTTDKPHASLELRCQRDDGIVVYLDGREVARDNMSGGAESRGLTAADAMNSAEESIVRRIPLAGAALPAGEHVLAISLHNPEAPSSDLRIAGITLVEVEAGTED